MELTVVLRAYYMSICTSLGRVRVYNLLGATLYYGLGHLLGEETTSELTSIVHYKSTPLYLLEATAVGSVQEGHVVEGF